MSNKPLILWVEDEKRYVRDMIEELEDDGFAVKTVGTCNDFLRDMDRILTTADLIILDLWLPVGSKSAQENVPARFEGSNRNTERAIWIYQELCKRQAEQSSKIAVLVLSGNLDADTLDSLIREGLSEEHLCKKPAPFDVFVPKVERLAKDHFDKRTKGPKGRDEHS